MRLVLACIVCNETYVRFSGNSEILTNVTSLSYFPKYMEAHEGPEGANAVAHENTTSEAID